MAELGLNIVVDRLNRGSDPYANRLARLRSDVQSALVDLEHLVRAEALNAGIAESDLEKHAGTVVGVVVRQAATAVVEDARRPHGRRVLSGWPVPPARPEIE
ncbi:hypothetical protein [Streptomyces sp. NPDC059278]|uniref:hypothetical protein n=1 Tax=Streptomyces sp. NPDC059278 TaxID=3346801 RepID=UPI0036CE54BF